jgi:hypothetical protein
MESIDLNIGRNVLDNWTIKDALREIISNAFDEHSRNNIIKLPEIKLNQNKYYEIIDFGNGIKIENFVQNINSSNKINSKTKGTYGYGLKDAIAVLTKENIEFEIKTKQYIFRSEYIKKQRGETLHIIVEKNTNKNCNYGTKFIFENIKKSDIDGAKKLFLEFEDIKQIYYEEDDNKIFKLENDKNEQNIYISGLMVIKNTSYKYSYNIKKDKDYSKNYNRDRKNYDKSKIKRDVTKFLKKIEFISNKNITNKDFFDECVKILKSSNMKEFNQKDIIKNIVEQINTLNKYIFIDSTDNASKGKNIFEKERKEKFILNNIICKKFKDSNGKPIKNISSLYNDSIFYGKSINSNAESIRTLKTYQTDMKKIVENIDDIINNIEKDLDIKIHEKIKSNIKNISIDDEFDSLHETKIESDSESESETELDNKNGSEIDSESDSDTKSESEENIRITNKNNFSYKDGYDFSSDELRISLELSKNIPKLKTIIMYKYIMPSLDDSEQIILFQKIIEFRSKDKNSWISWFVK